MFKEITWRKNAQGLMVATAIFLGIKYLFVDFGIDAEFQISMSYRLATGDIMFKEMWEPYQMSAFICAIFIKVYLAIFGTTTGIVLYLQALGVLLDGVIACILYRTVEKYLGDRSIAFSMAWVFFVVSPKDVPLPEYANMQIWFSMLLCITMFLYYKTEKIWMLILSALCLSGAVLAYPSCVILVVGVVSLLCYCGKKRAVLVFGGTCLLAGAVYLCLIFRQVSWEDFLVFIENMLKLETSHSAELSEKCLAYLKEAWQIAVVFCIVYLLAYVIINGCVGIRWRKKRAVKDKEFCRILTDLVFCGEVLLVSIYTVLCWQEYVRYCYSLVFIGVIFVGTHYRKRLSPDQKFFYFCGTILSLLEFVATLLLTNLQLVASVPYLLIAVIAAFLPIREALRMLDVSVIRRRVKGVALLMGVIFLVFRNVYIIRPMNGDVSTILNVRGIVKGGPAVGIVSEYMGPYMQNETMKEWVQYIEEGMSVYLIGGSLDTLGYLYAGTEIAAPSLVPTPGYNESILEYWERNPEKYPDVIVASCWYGAMHEELDEDSWIMRWIQEEYELDHYVDGKYWRYYFKDAERD